MTAGSTRGLPLGVLGVVCLVLQFGSISCRSEIFGIVNESVTFPVSSPVQVTEIMWTKNKDKVIDWEVGFPVKVFPPFVGRVYLNTTSGSLTIFNLTSLDEAEYRIESSSVLHSSFFLNVIDPLPSPTLNCSSTVEDITVHCRIPESYDRYAQHLKYSWDCFPALCANSSNTSQVLIKKIDDLSQKIHCIVSNPLSSRTSSLVLATCVPGGHSRHHFLIILPVAAVTALILFWAGFLKWGKRTECTRPS